MPLMSAELYTALLEAGTSEDTARKAAEAVAAFDQRFASLETRLVQIDGRLVLMQWMLGTVIVLVLGVFWKLLKP